MANAITIDQLYLMLEKAKEGGLGSKKIMLSSDDEGNEYHELFFGITENVADVFSGRYAPLPPFGVSMEDLKNYVILG